CMSSRRTGPCALRTGPEVAPVVQPNAPGLRGTVLPVQQRGPRRRSTTGARTGRAARAVLGAHRRDPSCAPGRLRAGTIARAAASRSTRAIRGRAPSGGDMREPLTLPDPPAARDRAGDLPRAAELRRTGRLRHSPGEKLRRAGAGVRRIATAGILELSRG